VLAFRTNAAFITNFQTKTLGRLFPSVVSADTGVTLISGRLSTVENSLEISRDMTITKHDFLGGSQALTLPLANSSDASCSVRALALDRNTVEFDTNGFVAANHLDIRRAELDP